MRVKLVAVATASASVGNSATADAVAGARASDSKAGKSKTDFSDALNAVLSHRITAGTTQDSLPAANKASASGVNALSATEAQNKQAAADSAANDQHGELTAVTQAKLVSALAEAANAKVKIVGSDGKTAASSDKKGEPATADAQAASPKPAPSETATDTARILTAMQTAQPVVTTVIANPDTKPTAVSRTMPQLEKAALGNAAQQALHTPAQAAKVEAQVLNAPANAKAAKTDTDTGAQSGEKQMQEKSANADAGKPADAQTAAVPDAPQPAATPAPAPLSTNIVSNLPAAAVGVATSSAATQTANTAATLQVAQQASSASTPPDLAALAVSIAAKSKDGQNEFNIRMEPAELGRVDVRLSVDAAGKAQAHLTADKPQTLQLLQNDKSTLERSLRDAGLDLSNTGLNFSLKGQQQNSTPTFVARNRALSINAAQIADVSSAAGINTTAGESRLDIRV